MKATETKLLTLLHGPKQFVIPIYQRTYSWTLKQCEQLWKDILRSGRDDSVRGHFIGSVVYVQKGLYNASGIQPLLVIDGQQRLTTASLLLLALAEAAEERGTELELTPKKIRNYYLRNADEEGDLRYKLLLTRSDQTTHVALVNETDVPADASPRLMQNFAFFQKEIAAVNDLAVVYKGIDKLIVVDISLDREHDNPQLIFESLNSTGLDLSQADLIRNYVLMGLEPKEQKKLYDEFWFPMEQSFGQENYAASFDRFMRDYLTIRVGRIPNIREVYAEFKAYVSGKNGPSIMDAVADIYAFSKHYVRIALDGERDEALRDGLSDIQTLKVDVSYPFLLEVYDDMSKGLVAKDDVVQIIRLVESYVFRRAVCGIPTNSLNKTFASLARSVDKSNYLQSTALAMAVKDAYIRFPDNREFRSELLAKNIYDFARRDYLLSKLENFDRKEKVNVSEYTVEHVMPQNPKLSPEWQAELGPEWKRVQDTYLHTLGNLTLTGYNSELSDRSFSEKQTMDGGFRGSPIRLNKSLANLDHWNENAIKARTQAIADLVEKVWAYPSLPPELLAQRELEAAGGASGEENGKLTGELKRLFEQLRERIHALDPTINEVSKKRYVAFRLQREFARVAAQNHRLRLVLLIKKHELSDPLGLAHPFPKTDKAKRVRVRVRPESDLDAVTALVKQAIEREKAHAE